MARQSHKGRARALFNRAAALKPPTPFNQIPFFSFQNLPVVKQTLLRLVKNCRHRKNTGKISTAPCCRTENGKVFKCTLYGHEPAKLYDCFICQQKKAIEDKAPWIMPLVQLSRGSEPQQSLVEVISSLPSEQPSHVSPPPLPGRLPGASDV